MAIKKGLSLEEAFKALNGRMAVKESLPKTRFPAFEDDLGDDNKITWEKKRFSQNEIKQKVREEKSGTDRNSRNRNLVASVRKAAPLCVETKEEIEEIFAQAYNTVEEIITDYAGAEQFIKENFADVISWKTNFEDDTAAWVIDVKTKHGDEKIYGESQGGPTSFINPAVDDTVIIKFPADEYIEKIGAEKTDFDWDDGRKAKFIYTDKAEESAQVGIEFEDGTFAVVGLNDDHLCDTYTEMVECIARYR